MHSVLTQATVSVSELKKNPTAVIDAADGASVAVMVHNKPRAYLVPAEVYRGMLDRLEDAELAALVRVRQSQRTVKVKLGEL